MCRTRSATPDATTRAPVVQGKKAMFILPALRRVMPWSTPAGRSPPAGHAHAPGWPAAAGLIALYFALQEAAGGLIALLLAIATGFVHTTHQIGPNIRAMLQQPGLPALTVILTLAVAGALVLLLVRRLWPALWSLSKPPGLGFSWPQSPWFFALALLVGLAAPLAGGWLTHWLAHGHKVTQDIGQLGAHTPPMLRVTLVVMVVSVGPLVEELLFRGVLLSALLQRWPAGRSVLISALVFALVHLPGLQFHGYALPDLILLALALAWLRLSSDSIWPAVLAHAVNNLLAVVAWFVAANV
jgi:membrane protease YdiL (CAAX protease family)